MSSCNVEGELRIGNTIDVWSQLANREAPNTPIDDATSVSFNFVDDTETDIGGIMTWNATYPVGSTQGAYVGQIPSTAQLTAGNTYKITYNGSGGSLNGVYREVLEKEAVE